MISNTRIELLTLGDELLNGIRLNEHLTHIGGLFASYGLELQRNISFRDAPEDIRRNFQASFEQADIVITTGGLGPTLDDNTREVIAEYLGLELEMVPTVEQSIRARFARMGREMTESNLKQCYCPRGAELLDNPNGTAPGIWIQHSGKHVIMLPGPSGELRPMLENIVIPRLQKAGVLGDSKPYIQLRTIGIGESLLQDKLSPFFEQHPGLGIAFCAHLGMVDLRLSRGQSDLDTQQLEAVAEECRKILGPDFVGYDDVSLAQVVFEHLRNSEKTLAVAESCTGGLLSNAFTDLPGASKVFLGGVVCYNNDAKTQLVDVPECILQQHGAVSSETAAAMATGAMEKFSSDYALSITGFAGPSGGDARNPLGTIYIGYSSPSGVWSIRMNYPGERVAVKVRAVNRALDVLRRMLQRYTVEDAIQSMMAIENN